MTQDRPCPVCASATGRSIGELPVTHPGQFSRNHFTLVECGCGLVYLSPLPTDGDLEELYVRSEQFSSATYMDAERVVAVLTYVKDRLGVLLADRSIDAPALKILEVGAGRAWMCRAAKEMGLAAETVAQDVSSECRDACPWVDHYVIGDVDPARLRDYGSFDVISMTHVFEHLSDPVGMLQTLAALLRPGGTVFITMPYRPSAWDGSIEGWLRYAHNHVPAHLQYFSESSLALAARKAGLHQAFWDSSHENGEAMEAHLKLPDRIIAKDEVVRTKRSKGFLDWIRDVFSPSS